MLYDRQVTGNLQKELQTLESWAQTYPRDAHAPGIIGGWVAFGTGKYERGIQASQEAIRLGPDIPFHMGCGLPQSSPRPVSAGRGCLAVAAEHKLEIPEMLVTRYYLAFLKGDQAGMDREIARAPGEHAEDWMAHNQALVLAHSGQMQRLGPCGNARSRWRSRPASVRRPRSTRPRRRCAKRIAGIGRRRRIAPGAALELAKGRDVEYAAAFALALSGESSESQRLAADLEKRFPEDTPVQFEYLPTLHALSALAHQAPLDAVERLQRRFLMTSPCRDGVLRQVRRPLSRIYPRTRRTWRQDAARKPLRNFKKY